MKVNSFFNLNLEYSYKLKASTSYYSCLINTIGYMVTAIVAYLDSLSLNTLFGRIEKWTKENVEKNTPRHYKEKVTSTIGEATRDHILYLKGKRYFGIQSIKELTGFKKAKWLTRKNLKNM